MGPSSGALESGRDSISLAAGTFPHTPPLQSSNSQVIFLRTPTDGSANLLNTAGERSRSNSPGQVGHSSVTRAPTDTPLSTYQRAGVSRDPCTKDKNA